MFHKHYQWKGICATSYMQCILDIKYIYIYVYNFTINQCIIIIVIPAMYEVIPFEKGLLYRKMWQNKCFYLSSYLPLHAHGFTWVWTQPVYFPSWHFENILVSGVSGLDIHSPQVYDSSRQLITNVQNVLYISYTICFFKVVWGKCWHCQC